MIFFLSVFLIFSSTQVFAFSCLLNDQDSPYRQAGYIDANDIVLEGKVIKDIKPSFWTQNFSDSVFSVAIIEPLKIYKGTVTEPVRVINKFYKQDKTFRYGRSLGAPTPPQVQVGSTYNLALKYDEEREVYTMQTICGQLPQFNYLDSLKKIKEVKNFPENDNDVEAAATIKNCKLYFPIPPNWIGNFDNYNKITFKNPILLELVNSEQPIDDVFIYTRNDELSAIGKNGETYFQLIDCAP